MIEVVVLIEYDRENILEEQKKITKFYDEVSNNHQKKLLQYQRSMTKLSQTKIL